MNWGIPGQDSSTSAGHVDNCVHLIFFMTMALMYPKMMSKFMAPIMQVGIGSGVLVEEGALEALLRNCPGAPAKYRVLPMPMK